MQERSGMLGLGLVALCSLSAGCGADAEPTTIVFDGPCPDDMVLVPALAVCVDRYEASRGRHDTARSEAGALPWTDLMAAEASAACEAAGKRLCTMDEWQAACVGPSRGERHYPYDGPFDPARCNGGGSGRGGIVPTGTHAGCEGGFPGLFDMSGNAAEYVHMPGHAFGDHDAWLGGQYDSGEWGLRCEAGTSDSRVAAIGPPGDIGFRCCVDAHAEPVPEVIPDACPPDMVRIGESASCIDRYEASEGDDGVALSVAGATPWVSIDLIGAREACAAAGKHLCDGVEWSSACGEGHPYGADYEAGRCNGADAGVGAALPTGSLSGCEGGLPGLFDMSGNVAEWIDSPDDCRGGSLDICYVPGGSFSSEAGSMSCRSYLTDPVFPTTTADEIGFRCCLRL